MIRIFGIQTLNSILSSLGPYIQPRTLAYWTMLLTIKEGLPASVNLIQTTPHRYSQKLFFPVILDSVMLTINIHHHITCHQLGAFKRIIVVTFRTGFARYKLTFNFFPLYITKIITLNFFWNHSPFQ